MLYPQVLAILMSPGIIIHLHCKCFAPWLRATEVAFLLAYAAHSVPLPSTLLLQECASSWEYRPVQATTKLRPSGRLEYVQTLIQARLPVYWMSELSSLAGCLPFHHFSDQFFQQKVKKRVK